MVCADTQHTPNTSMCHVGSHRKPGGRGGARRSPREHPLWLNQDEQGSDGLSGIAARLLGVGLTLTDFLPTDDCRKEIPH